jgi:Rad3-related DNA helicase
MGVTGTLDKLPKCQEEVLKSKEWYNVANLYYIPSVYGKSRRTKLGAQVVATAQYFTQICKAISNVQSKMPRPVFVFFDSIDKVNEFYLSPEFQELKENAITLTERNDPDAIKSRIIRATRAKNITIMTKAFGRGIDFMVN